MALLRWLELGDARLPAVRQGTVGGPLAILVPGLSEGLLPVSEPQVRRDLPRLPAVLADHEVWTVGYRQPLAGRVEVTDLAEDLAVAVRQLRPRGGASLVAGHSMGAMVALHLGAASPDQVGRLVLSAATAAADEALRAVLDRWDRLLVEGRVRDFLLDSLATAYDGPELVRRQLVARLWPTPDVADRVSRHLALAAACRRHDARAVLDRITAPALVVAGADDPVVPAERSRELARSLDATLEVLPGARHGFPEQHRLRYVRAVTRWMSGDDGPRPTGDRQPEPELEERR